MLSKIDWLRLSNVETASGIEVLYAAKLFRKKSFLHKKILQHALDEYRHSSIFRSYAKRYQKEVKKLSSTQAILGEAGLANSPLNPLDDNILKMCSYLYIGEYRAIDFNKQTKKLIGSDKAILKDLMAIEMDEERHAQGVKKFLETNAFIKYARHLFAFKFRYLAQKITKAGLVNRLQGSATGFLAKRLFKIIPQSLFSLKRNSITLKEALISSKKM